MVKDVSANKDALVKPTSFEQIYNNAGSKAERVSIWKPNCPNGYIALGYVANPRDSAPSADATNFRCVNETITTFGQWSWVYNDVNSESKADLTIYRADPATVRGDGVGVWAMSAVPFYNEMDTDAIVLRADSVSIRSQKPIKSMKITSLVYDLENKQIISQGPSDITSGARTVADNCRKSLLIALFYFSSKTVL